MSLFVLLQHLLPHHLLSRLVGLVAACQWPVVKNPLMRWFIKRYGVNMTEALITAPEEFSCFNDFFTRELAPGVRPLDDTEGAILCPADGAISAVGDISNNTLIQAKGMDFSLEALLGEEGGLASQFRNGRFCTVYLSPKDYHRVHIPLAGRLTSMTYIPGRLFSVNQQTSEQVPGLFARNERAVCYFDTDRGPMAVILVGAMIVAAIDTVWAGQVAPSGNGLTRYDYSDRLIELAKGAELGRFRLGSTAIVLFGPDMMRWNEPVHDGIPVKMGQSLGVLT